MRSEVLAASVNQLGGRIRNALKNPAADTFTPPNFSQKQAEASAQGTQLKASRDAAKAKLVLRELKTIKADLAFAKQRCAQLEEENKILRETKQTGVKAEEDDDLIRIQLETLLAQKSRLAQENSMYARENRFLREIVDFHQFSTHDVFSLDVGDVEDSNPKEDSNHTYNENMFPVVEAYLAHEKVSPVPYWPESPVHRPGEPSSPKSSNL